MFHVLSTDITRRSLKTRSDFICYAMRKAPPVCLVIVLLFQLFFCAAEHTSKLNYPEGLKAHQSLRTVVQVLDTQLAKGGGDDGKW